MDRKPEQEMCLGKLEEVSRHQFIYLQNGPEI